MKKIFIISRLNIWYVGEKYQNKTAGNQTMFNTIKGYSDNGYEVLVLSSGVPNKLDLGLKNVIVRRSKFALFTDLKKKLKKNNNTNVQKDFDVGDQHIPYSNVMALKIWGIFATLEAFFLNLKFKSDIFYGYEFLGVLPAYLLSKIFKKPFVTRYQGTRLGFFLNNDKQFYACKDTIYSMNLPADLVIIGDDGTQGDLVCKKLGLSLDNVKLWMNGVDHLGTLKSLKKDVNFKKEMGIPNSAKIISSSNRFDFWKRIDRLIEVFASIERENKDIYLVLVGDGPNRLYIEELAKKLKVYDKIIFCGALEHEKAVRVIKNSDIYMTMCDYTNLSNSIIEAQVMGIPVITLDVGGIKKLITNNVNGYLFKEYALNKVPQAVNKLLTDRDEYSRIQNNELNVAKEKIVSWEDRMKMEVKCVNQLISKRYIDY